LGAMPQRFTLNGRSGAGPSHRSQSSPAGGASSGGLPCPSFLVDEACRVRQKGISPAVPLLKISPPFWRNAPAPCLVPACTTRLYLRAAWTILTPSFTYTQAGFSTYTSLPALQASTVM